QKYVDGKNRSSLESDDEFLGYAVVRGIEIIGEAARHVSEETKATHSSIPWHNMVGMRNRIAYDYMNVDYDIVWEVATVNLPQLIPLLKTVLAKA
ncbi:MAG: HepT-like ribonuclease domain-containing protein, partial [Chloroflexota bacterium]